MATIVAPQPTSVYRYYDVDDLLIYVGITSRGMTRNREHNATKEWWPYVSRQEVEHFGSRERAAERERSLIHAFRPPFNRQHNAESGDLRAAYLAYRGVTDVAAPTRRRLFNTLERQLPLMFVEKPGRRHIIMRSLPEHAPLACAVVHRLGVKVTGGTGGTGLVRDIENRGMFAIFHLRVDSTYALSGASAYVKFLDQKTETFVLRSVRLHRESGDA